MLYLSIYLCRDCATSFDLSTSPLVRLGFVKILLKYRKKKSLSAIVLFSLAISRSPVVTISSSKESKITGREYYALLSSPHGQVSYRETRISKGSFALRRTAANTASLSPLAGVYRRGTNEAVQRPSGSQSRLAASGAWLACSSRTANRAHKAAACLSGQVSRRPTLVVYTCIVHTSTLTRISARTPNIFYAVFRPDPRVRDPTSRFHPSIHPSVRPFLVPIHPFPVRAVIRRPRSAEDATDRAERCTRSDREITTSRIRPEGP